MANDEVKKHLESIESVACETYTSLIAAQAALAAIKASAQAALTALGK